MDNQLPPENIDLDARLLIALIREADRQSVEPSDALNRVCAWRERQNPYREQVAYRVTALMEARERTVTRRRTARPTPEAGDAEDVPAEGAD